MDNNYIVRIDWDEVGNYLNILHSRLVGRVYSGVYGLPRGGLVLAAWLAHKLYVPMLSQPDRNCIIIDDICDSGDGLRKCLEDYGLNDGIHSCYITTMFVNEDSNFFNNIDFSYKIKGDHWIAFPWEK